MSKKRQRIKKIKKRERLVKAKLLKRREDIRDEARTEREIERLEWENRYRIPPIRKSKENEA